MLEDILSIIVLFFVSTAFMWFDLFTSPRFPKPSRPKVKITTFTTIIGPTKVRRR